MDNFQFLFMQANERKIIKTVLILLRKEYTANIHLTTNLNVPVLQYLNTESGVLALLTISMRNRPLYLHYSAKMAVVEPSSTVSTPIPRTVTRITSLNYNTFIKRAKSH